MTRDLYKYFRIEGREILDDLVKGILDLEKGNTESGLVGRLFRLAHTLKGAARVVKQPEIADHAHAIEDALSPFREGTSVATREQVGELLAQVDAIALQLATLTPPANAGESPDSTGAPFGRPKADIDEVSALLDGVTEIGVHLGAARRVADSLERVHHLTAFLGEQLTSYKVLGPRPGVSERARTIADEIERVVSNAQRDLTASLEHTHRELNQVREAAEQLKLLPVESMFGSLERASRDAAMSLGKKIAFESRGGGMRFEANMLGAIQGALVQAVRNAVAHGIETEAERISLGKPAEGQVVLEVRRRGNRVSFACRDDGRGVDLDAVRRAASRREPLLDAGTCGPQDLLDLLMQGGISTSVGVTETSGRGVGLDIVRATAAKLGGTAHLRTSANAGVVLEMVVPASLSSVDALVVEAAEQTTVIPLDAIRCTVRLDRNDVTTTPTGETIVFEGKVIPFAPLARSFRPLSLAARAPRKWSAVILESHGALAAVGVDRLVCAENVVLRPLPPFTPYCPAVLGASLDLEGNPRLVLDPDGLLEEARHRDASPKAPPPARPAILVIDDSLTTRTLEQSILESAGYEVDVATSGEEGLEKALQRNYGLFVVDVEMSGMDGFTFIERSRGNPALEKVPALLVTSRESAKDKDRGLAVGAHAYIVKGEFNQSDLLAHIRGLVG